VSIVDTTIFIRAKNEMPLDASTDVVIQVASKAVRKLGNLLTSIKHPVDIVSTTLLRYPLPILGKRFFYLN